MQDLEPVVYVWQSDPSRIAGGWDLDPDRRNHPYVPIQAVAQARAEIERLEKEVKWLEAKIDKMEQEQFDRVKQACNDSLELAAKQVEASKGISRSQIFLQGFAKSRTMSAEIIRSLKWRMK